MLWLEMRVYASQWAPNHNEHYKLCKCGILYYESAKEICVVCGKSVIYIYRTLDIWNQSEKHSHALRKRIFISHKYEISCARYYSGEYSLIFESEHTNQTNKKFRMGEGWEAIINGQLNGMSPVTYEVRLFGCSVWGFTFVFIKEEIAINIWILLLPQSP